MRIPQLTSPGPEIKLTFKIAFFCLIVFLLYLVGNYLFVSFTAKNNLKKDINNTIDQVKKDLKYEDGKWDTYTYVYNPEISFDNPLYIFTSEGFLINRIKPITGFLDTSIFDYALSFEEPQTHISEINEKWRILSHPIERDGEIKVALLVAYFDPPESAAEEIDEQLLDNAKKIDGKIKFSDGKLDVSAVESKDIGVSYELIDRFNKVLRSEGGAPAYIDRSFVQRTLELKETIIKNEETSEPFLVITDGIYDKDNSLIGIIAAARSYKNTQIILKNQALFSLTSGLVAVLMVVFFALYVFGRELPNLIKIKVSQFLEPKEISFEKITFNSESSTVELDNVKVEIPSDTNQYYLLKSLFSAPKKKWENDELLEKLGLEFGEGNQRKVYDAAKAINTKLNPFIGKELIIYKAKQYFINPEIASKIA